MRQWPNGTHTKRLSADGILSALANRMSLTLSPVGATPFTRPASDGPDLRTNSLVGGICTWYWIRTVPANTDIELSLGDTDSKRLCPVFANCSPSPLEMNGGKRSRCTVISGQERVRKRAKIERGCAHQQCGLVTNGVSPRFVRVTGKGSTRPRGLNLLRVISTDHLRLPFSWYDLHPAPASRAANVDWEYISSGKFTSNGRESV